MKPTEAYLKRELRRFLSTIGFKNNTREDREKFMTLIQEMQETGRKHGMSESDLATTYSANALLALYRKTIDRSH